MTTPDDATITHRALISVHVDDLARDEARRRALVAGRPDPFAEENDVSGSE